MKKLFLSALLLTGFSAANLAAARIPLSETGTTNIFPLPYLPVPGRVFICEGSVTAGNVCDSQGISDLLVFSVVMNAGLVTLRSDIDGDLYVIAPDIADTGFAVPDDPTAPHRAEGIFGGISYQPGGVNPFDPNNAPEAGYDPNGSSPFFTVPGDPEDAPEPSTLVLAAIGLFAVARYAPGNSRMQRALRVRQRVF